MRELLYAQRLTGHGWPTAMTELLLSAQRLTLAARRQQRPLDADTVAAFATVYDDIVREGEQLHPVILKLGLRRSGRIVTKQDSLELVPFWDYDRPHANTLPPDH